MFLWLKAFHIIAMVTWFSGLFYLPRLFVYHTQVSKKDHNNYARYCTMEHKLYKYIMIPAAIATTLLGLWLLFGYTFIIYKKAIWLHTKLTFVLLLWGYHLYSGRLVKLFANKQNTYSDKFYRIYNEIPTVFLIAIVCLTVVKPF